MRIDTPETPELHPSEELTHCSVEGYTKRLECERARLEERNMLPDRKLHARTDTSSQTSPKLAASGAGSLPWALDLLDMIPSHQRAPN